MPVAVKVIEAARKKIDDSVQHEANILGWKHNNIIKIIKVNLKEIHHHIFATNHNLLQIKVQEDCAIIIMERLPGQCLQYLVDSIEISLFHRLRYSSVK